MKLQQFMLRKKMSSKKLAKKLGVSEITIWRWLAGAVAPSQSNLWKLEELSKGRVTWKDFKLGAPREESTNGSMDHRRPSANEQNP
jgi:transcriptional regulator with XRE-family HTH domain